MRIGIIWKNDYPWDVQVEKIAETLFEAGNEIYILASNYGKKPRIDSLNGIKIHRLPYSNCKLINSIISVPFYLNPFWLHMANKVVLEEKIDLLIVRDLPLVLIGILIKKKHKIPLVLDMAENYPAMYRMRLEKGGLGAITNFILKNPSLMELVENIATRNSDHIFVVVEESAKRLIGKGANKHKISIVSNTPKLEKFNLVLNRPDNNHHSSQKFIIGFVGYMQKGRGLETIIFALKILKKKGLPVFIIFVGDGDYLPQLQALAKQYNVSSLINFTGWVDHSQVPNIIAKCDAGIIPHVKNDHTDTTVPNKLFDFMASYKSVIVSNAAPLKRIVAEENCGVVFEAGNENDLANAIEKVVKDKEVCFQMGLRGRKAVEEQYNWEKDSIVLNKVVNELAT